MYRGKVKVYTYTRVSAAMQTDGYSLDEQKVREGKWNGGFAPYGYQLVDGELQIKAEEATAICVIFEQYATTDIDANGKSSFDAHLVRLILKNPVYCGKIAYGRRKTEKVHGTRNEYHLVE